MLSDKIAQHERWIVSVIVACFVMAALIFNVNSPLLEGPNEVEHYRFMRLIAQNGELPDRIGYPYGQLHQAPLYYIVGSPILMAIDDPAFTDISQRLNPYHAHEFNIPSSDNKNTHLHLAADADTNVARVVFLLRLYSTLLGTLTVITGYAIVRLLFPNSPALRLLALSVIAFTPQFVYMSSSINNDNFLFLGIALSFYFALRQAIYKPTYVNSFLLGASLGVALLSKSSAGMLVFPMAIAVLIDRRTWFWHAPLTLAVTILVAGWWYIENYALYGDFTLVQTMFTTWPREMIGENGEPVWSIGIRRAWYGYESFWGRYGHGAVALGEEIYRVYDTIVIIALIGLGIWLFRQRQQWHNTEKPDTKNLRVTVIVASFTLVWIAALIYSSSTVLSGNQGRYLLPGFSGWAIFIAVGIHQLLPKPTRIYVALGFVVLMSSLLFYSQARYFLPAYQLSDAPPDAKTIYRYDDTIELIGVDPRQFSANPNDIIELTLSWRVLQPTNRELLTFVHSVDSELVRRNSYPGTGLFLAEDWQAGDTWSETYIIRVPADAQRQRVYPLIAGYYDFKTNERLQATDVNGNPVTPFVAEIIVHGEQSTIDTNYQLGNLFTMTEPTLTRDVNNIELCLAWHVEQTPNADYQMLVHFLDDDSNFISGADFQPQQGIYPTRVWQAGETVQDCHTIALPDDETVTQIGVGMYDLATVTRLSLTTKDGQQLQNNMLILDIPNPR